MTITLYLNKGNLLDDLTTISYISQNGEIETVQKYRDIFQPITFSFKPTDNFYVAINVTVEEFALINMFNQRPF